MFFCSKDAVSESQKKLLCRDTLLVSNKAIIWTQILSTACLRKGKESNLLFFPVSYRLLSFFGKVISSASEEGIKGANSSTPV
jgi:hypothetical protein